MEFDSATTSRRAKDNGSKHYQSPKLTVYGSVNQLTRNGTGSGADGGTTLGMTMGS